MPEVTIGEIADFLQGSFEGDRSHVIRGVRPLSDATGEDLTFLANPKYAKQVASSRAGAILVDRKLEGSGANWIRVDDPYLSLARVLQEWFYEVPLPEGISPEARIEPSAEVDPSARIAAGVVIGENVTIGKNVAILPGCVVGRDSSIGDDTLLYANVTVYHRTAIGRRCILHSGVVVGSDGFGFVTSGGKHYKIPQIGVVRIEDDVEIGANTTIDRAALGETVIGEGTKIDNLVQIAHNVKTGKHCIIVSQVGIAGSSELGDYVVIGGQAGVSGHLKIGSQVMVAAKAAVMKGFDQPGQIAGTPARPLREHLKTEAMIRRLPKVIERLKRVEAKLGLAKDEQDKE